MVGSGPSRSRGKLWQNRSTIQIRYKAACLYIILVVSEMSQPSLGGERDDTTSMHDKGDSPPASPMCMADGKGRGYTPKTTGALDTHWEEPDGKTGHG